MYCNNCGSKVKDEAQFCPNCGSKIDETKKEAKEEKKVETKTAEKPVVVKTEENKGEGLGTASMVIGIIAIVLSLVLNVLTLVLSVTGLILGIVNKAKGGKKVSGIVLNIIAIFLSFFIFVFMIFLGVTLFSSLFDGYYSLGNPVSGRYNCSSFDGSGPSSSYIVRMELNDNNRFLWGKYGDVNRNYVRGTYTYEDLHKKNGSGQYSYYKVVLDGDIFYQNGVKQSEPYASKYEFGITKQNGKKEGILMNEQTYNMYYCYEE